MAHTSTFHPAIGKGSIHAPAEESRASEERYYALVHSLKPEVEIPGFSIGCMSAESSTLFRDQRQALVKGAMHDYNLDERAPVRRGESASKDGEPLSERRLERQPFRAAR